jgi:hypothetical protein
MAKTLVADHATVTQSDGHTRKGITAGGVSYLQIGNALKVRLLSPKDNQSRSDENLRDAKSYMCQSLPDSSIDGVAVANYRTRTETKDTVVESKIAISKASGWRFRSTTILAKVTSRTTVLATPTRGYTRRPFRSRQNQRAKPQGLTKHS